MYKLTGFVLFVSFLQIIPATTTKTGTSSISTTCQSTVTSLIESLQDCATALDPVTAAKKCSSCFSTCCNLTSSQLDTLITSVDDNVKNIKDLLSISSINQNAINNLTDIIKDLLHIVTNSPPSVLPNSCQDIKMKWPDSSSGYYYIRGKDVYCHMEELCNSEGGWTKIAYLDMSDSSANCPPGFRLYQSKGVRACGRQSFGDFSCQSVKFPSYGISYTQVCGRVVGYQYATPDAIQHGQWKNPQKYIGGTDPKHNDINSVYVDGVSLTHGSPRQHVWTFMAGPTANKTIYDGRFNCPCSPGSLQSSHIQFFVGDDYFCESGNSDPNGNIPRHLYTTDPLWDGKGCGSIEQTCCQAPGLPWFHKVLNSTTTDYLEMRVCGDQETNDEDVPVNYYEIYIR